MAAYTTIDDPSAHFKVQLYTGNGTAIASGGNVITNYDISIYNGCSFWPS